VPILPQQVNWGEDNPLEAAPELTEEEKDILQKRMAAMDKLLAEKHRAKYKIEIMFSHKRSAREPQAGIVSFWESGSKLHGGGDTKVYLCPSEREGRGRCLGIIGYDSQGYGHLVCPKCQQVWQGKQGIGEQRGRWPVQTWAGVLLRYFMQLENNADIYIKVPKYDIRKAAELEQQKQMMGDALNVVRRQKTVYVYPLKNIIKDTSNGADLYGRFKALLSA